nr:ABC transporter permease [Geodermatophilaceae bacterium]
MSDLLTTPGSGRGPAGSLRHLGRALTGALVSVALVVVLSFFLFRVLPGDPVLTMTRGRPVGAQQIAELRAQLGLDRSLPAQFAGYLADLLHGDLG